MVVFLAIRSIRIVKQSEVCIIERLGRFHKVAEAGVFFIPGLSFGARILPSTISLIYDFLWKFSF